MSVKTEYDERYEKFLDVLEDAAKRATNLTIEKGMHGHSDMSPEHHAKTLKAAHKLQKLHVKLTS